MSDLFISRPVRRFRGVGCVPAHGRPKREHGRNGAVMAQNPEPWQRDYPGERRDRAACRHAGLHRGLAAQLRYRAPADEQRHKAAGEERSSVSERMPGGGYALRMRWGAGASDVKTRSTLAMNGIRSLISRSSRATMPIVRRGSRGRMPDSSITRSSGTIRRISG